MSKLQAIRPVVEEEDFLEINSNTSGDEDNEKHSNLLNAITKLGSTKKVRIAQRTEPISKINEHALVQAIAEKPRLGRLPAAVKQAKQRGHTLKTPLEKPQALRVERAAGYEKVKAEVSKWDNIVKGNRVAEQLIFPLTKPSINLRSSRDFSSKFKPTTPLEQQISALLKGNKHVQADNEELTPAEQEALSSMSLKEALERRKELARSRVLQSYQEAKARRQNKIKSKKYHRLLKREKMKNHVKEFENLAEQDPEGALEKLEQLERKRIEERMTLKHKGAGKWAKLQAIRARYDDNAREALADQLRIGKEVTRKVKKIEDESDEDIPIVPLEKSDNPWLGGSEPSPAVQEITSGYRKLWNDVNESKTIRKKMNEDDAVKEKLISENDLNELIGDSVSETSDENDQEEIESTEPAEEMKNKFSEELEEDLISKKTLDDFAHACTTKSKKRSRSKKAKVDRSEDALSEVTTVALPVKRNTDIDPNQFVTMSNVVALNSSVPATQEGGEEEDDEEEAATQRRMTLAEAFAEDDVVDQFKEEKKRIIDAAAPKDIDLTLPGWGEWGGSGLKISKRKKKRFIIKAPPAPARRDDNQGNLIINEDKSQSMRRQQVNDLPFPFKSAAAFESTIRAPVTSTFIPESASRKLTAPKVISKIGTIIAPMDEEAIISTATRTEETEDDQQLQKKSSGKEKRGGMKRKMNDRGNKASKPAAKLRNKRK
nr:EOG090X08JJ [Eurycercus lamellatus]